MCSTLDVETSRSADEWYFFALCKNCLVAAASIVDGGAAISRLRIIHKKLEKESNV